MHTKHPLSTTGATIALFLLAACLPQPPVYPSKVDAGTVAEGSHQSYNRHTRATTVVGPRAFGPMAYYLQADYVSKSFPAGDKDFIFHGVVVHLVTPGFDSQHTRTGDGWSAGRRLVFKRDRAVLNHDIITDALAKGIEIQLPPIRGSTALVQMLNAKRVVTIPAIYFQGFYQRLPCELPQQACVAIKNFAALENELDKRVEKYRKNPHRGKLRSGFLLL